MTADKAAKDELQTRVCRCCESQYRYPVPKSTATRFYCEQCAELRAGDRRMFELFNKRLRRMAKDISDIRKMAGQMGSNGAGHSKDPQ